MWLVPQCSNLRHPPHAISEPFKKMEKAKVETKTQDVRLILKRRAETMKWKPHSLNA